MYVALKIGLGLAVCLLLLAALLAAWLWPRYPYGPVQTPTFELQRDPANPVISAALHRSLQAKNSEGGYTNINGPSVIRVPVWVDNPLGRYYLYFAHHKGNHIRLAYAERPTGPWTLHEGGILSLAESGFPTDLTHNGPGTGLRDLWDTFSVHVVRDYLLLADRATRSDQQIRKARGISIAANAAAHIASPDVIVDNTNQRLLMYFHGMNGNSYQSSRIAESSDGVNFKVLEEGVFSTYLRGFNYRDHHYVLGMPGVIYRSNRPDGGFQPRDRILFEPAMRHAGVWVEHNSLNVLWSRVGDAPEQLLYSVVNLSAPDWNDWIASEGTPILQAEATWEGADLPVLPSLRGELDLPAHELRDPFVLVDRDGQKYLYYVGSGEQAIGVATLQ